MICRSPSSAPDPMGGRQAQAAADGTGPGRHVCRRRAHGDDAQSGQSYRPPAWTRFPVWDWNGLFGPSSRFFPKMGYAAGRRSADCLRSLRIEPGRRWPGWARDHQCSA